MDFTAVLNANGYSQRGLAKKTGISQSEISRMANGSKPWHPTILDMVEEMTNEDITVRIPVCEDCGGAHYTRCNHKEGAVVILSGSEAIVAKSVTAVPKARETPRRADYRPRLSLQWKARVAADGRSLEEILVAGLSASSHLPEGG